MGSTGAFGERGAGEPRRWSLLERISNFLSHVGASAGELDDTSKSHEAELAALRKRMTPPESDGDELPLATRARRREHPWVPPPVRAVFDAQAKALEDFPWPGQGADPEWKPVVLSSEEMIVNVPPVEELADESGGEPTTLRFPAGS